MSPILIIGGGHSVNDLDLEVAKKFTTIAINNAWKRFPRAVECFAGDHRWWGEWGEGEKLLKGFKGQISSCRGVGAVPKDRGVHLYSLSADEKMLWNPEYVLAPDSGTKAICRAYHRGGNPILLAGYDLAHGPNGQSHFHQEHQAPTNPQQWVQWGSVHKRVAELLKTKKVDLFRVTEPGLDCIPYRPLESFL